MGSGLRFTYTVFYSLFPGEVEDLTGRLKTSRQRVADLERSLASTSNSSQKLEQVCACSGK